MAPCPRRCRARALCVPARWELGGRATSTASILSCGSVDELLPPCERLTTRRQMSDRPHESMCSMKNGSNAPPGSDREAGPGGRSSSSSLETGKVCDIVAGEQSASMTKHGRSRNGPSWFASFMNAYPTRKFCSVDLGRSRHCCGGFAAQSGLHDVVALHLPLRRLFPLCEVAHSMISVDTGPAHVAAAVGSPLVVLFGNNSPRHWLPRSFCGSPVIGLGGAPGFRHVNQISVQAVFEAWRSLPAGPIKQNGAGNCVRKGS